MIADTGSRLSREVKIALLLAVVAALFRLPFLAFPTEEYFDEVYHAKTARQYLVGENPIEWVHPPTAKLLIAVGVYVFGYEPWAWRLPAALAGIALAPVFFLFARRVVATERAALFASVLLLSDGVYLVQSRIAMTNIFAVLFQVTAALFLLRAALRERLPALDMSLLGLFLGLALSTRWTSLWAAGFLGLVLLVVRGRRILAPREMALTLLAFVVLPVALYVLSYVPLMMQWRARGEFPSLFSMAALERLWREQRNVWNYHANLNATHPYFSKWWTWPWLYRPTWYFFANAEGVVRGIIAVGNPILWWASVPATLWALVTGMRARDPRRLFTGAGFCLLYLPWGISPRTLNYSHYLFEAIPYACLSLAMILEWLWDQGGLPRSVARGYLTAVVAIFVIFLPLLLATPIPSSWFFARAGGVGIWTWFPSWI
jgi:dolichyl-phosphate-mannose--protein O-mannosyl transferase